MSKKPAKRVLSRDTFVKRLVKDGSAFLWCWTVNGQVPDPRNPKIIRKILKTKGLKIVRPLGAVPLIQEYGGKVGERKGRNR